MRAEKSSSSKLKPQIDPGLAELRDEIEILTRSLIDLVGKREAVSAAVARVKRATNLQVENRKVESKLMGTIADYAESIGVDRQLAKTILHELLISSKNRQRRELYREDIVAFLNRVGITKVAVIGSGRMGGWIAAYFKMLNRDLLLLDKDVSKSRRLASQLGCAYAKKLKEVCGTADLIVFAVPIKNTPALVNKAIEIVQGLVAAGNRISPPTLVELSSVKSPISKTLRKSRYSKEAIKLYSIHPLFGPDAHPFATNPLIEVVTMKTGGDADPLIPSLFPHFKIRQMTIDEHDKLMSIMLSLPHLLAFIFADVTARNERSLTVRRRGTPNAQFLTSPSFARMLDFATRVLSESPLVYHEIQSLNKNNAHLIQEIGKSLQSVAKLRRDRKLFAKFFGRTSRRLGELHDAATA